jgi:hypothetical protein
VDSLKLDVFKTLETDWGSYVEKIQALPPLERQAFVERQGYRRLADLLAHVIAWWEEGLPAIDALIADPQWVTPDYEVDAFNAAAVARFASWDEGAVIALFEKRRREWVELVERIPEEAWQIPDLGKRVEIEIIGHYGGHRFD